VSKPKKKYHESTKKGKHEKVGLKKLTVDTGLTVKVPGVCYLDL
jgi:hypothetical protein